MNETGTFTGLALYRCSTRTCRRPVAVEYRATVTGDSWKGTRRTNRYVGARTLENHVARLVCPGCGRHTLTGGPVAGRASDHECDARCVNAVGPDCECSCAGQNHGRAHLI